MIKKKLHTLQYIQNKKEIEDIKRLMNMLGNVGVGQDEFIQKMENSIELLIEKEKKYMRRLQLFTLFILLGGISLIAFITYILWN